MSTTEGIIQIKPFEIETLTDLNITSRVNDHSRATFRGTLKNDANSKKDAYVFETEADTKIKIIHVESREVLFTGIATRIEVTQTHSNVYEIECEAVSHTYDLDVKLRKRSYQKKGVNFSKLIDEITEDRMYNRHKVTHEINQEYQSAVGQPIEEFILQYAETDWEFLKRLASRKPFHTVLVADQTAGNPKFTFGLSKDEAKELRLRNDSFTVLKSMKHFREKQTNYLPDLNEKDFIGYEVDSLTFVTAGSKVKYKNKEFFVYEAQTTLKDGTHYNHHLLMLSKKGFRQGPILNTQIVGLSLQGNVREIKNDHLKIELKDIEHEFKKNQALLFPYATFYSAENHTGWYCMPEINDLVQLYFPTPQEAEAIAINSIRQYDANQQPRSGDKITKPEVKVFRTNFGKELLFNKEEIIITGKDKNGEEGMLIRLSDKDGIEIFSDKAIRIHANRKLTLDSDDTIEVTAENELKLNCGRSALRMKDDSTYLTGRTTRNN